MWREYVASVKFRLTCLEYANRCQAGHFAKDCPQGGGGREGGRGCRNCG